MILATSFASPFAKHRFVETELVAKNKAVTSLHAGEFVVIVVYLLFIIDCFISKIKASQC